MANHKSSPCAAVNGRTGEDSYHQDYNRHDPSRQFPICRVHATAIVKSFPAGCPLSKPNPLLAVHELQEASWRLAGVFVGSSDAISVFETHDACRACVDDNLSHRRVMALRERLVCDIDPDEQYRQIREVIDRTPKHGAGFCDE